MAEGHDQPTDGKAVNEALSHETPAAYDDETVIWEGSPSQWVNLGTYIWWIFISGAMFVCKSMWDKDMANQYPAWASEVADVAVMVVYAIAAISCLYAYLKVRCEYTTITRNKIKEAKGITSIFRQELFCELSDVEDIKSPPAGLLALFGLASIIIETSDQDQPIIKIRAIRRRQQVVDTIHPVWRKLRMDRKGFFPGR